MDLNRLRELSGMPLSEAVMSDADSIAALEKQWKDEVDSRARATIEAQIKKLKAKTQSVKEGATSPADEIAALEQQYKTEVDPRARSTIAAQIKTLKANMGGDDNTSGA